MATYTPDSWAPVVIEYPQYGKVYKVLASWYGGFTGANSWKLSSGIEDIKLQEPGVLELPQSSGSTYVVSTQTHVSSIMCNVFASFEEDLSKQEGASIKMLSVEELLLAFNKHDLLNAIN